MVSNANAGASTVHRNLKDDYSATSNVSSTIEGNIHNNNRTVSRMADVWSAASNKTKRRDDLMEQFEEPEDKDTETAELYEQVIERKLHKNANGIISEIKEEKKKKKEKRNDDVMMSDQTAKVTSNTTKSSNKTTSPTTANKTKSHTITTGEATPTPYPIEYISQKPDTVIEFQHGMKQAFSSNSTGSGKTKKNHYTDLSNAKHSNYAESTPQDAKNTSYPHFPDFKNDERKYFDFVYGSLYYETDRKYAGVQAIVHLNVHIYDNITSRLPPMEKYDNKYNAEIRQLPLRHLPPDTMVGGGILTCDHVNRAAKVGKYFYHETLVSIANSLNHNKVIQSKEVLPLGMGDNPKILSYVGGNAVRIDYLSSNVHTIHYSPTNNTDDRCIISLYDFPHIYSHYGTKAEAKTSREYYICPYGQKSNVALAPFGCQVSIEYQYHICGKTGITVSEYAEFIKKYENKDFFREGMSIFFPILGGYSIGLVVYKNERLYFAVGVDERKLVTVYNSGRPGFDFLEKEHGGRYLEFMPSWKEEYNNSFYDYIYQNYKGTPEGFLDVEYRVSNPEAHPPAVRVPDCVDKECADAHLSFKKYNCQVGYLASIGAMGSCLYRHRYVNEQSFKTSALCSNSRSTCELHRDSCRPEYDPYYLGRVFTPLGESIYGREPDQCENEHPELVEVIEVTAALPKSCPFALNRKLNVTTISGCSFIPRKITCTYIGPPIRTVISNYANEDEIVVKVPLCTRVNSSVAVPIVMKYIYKGQKEESIIVKSHYVQMPLKGEGFTITEIGTLKEYNDDTVLKELSTIFIDTSEPYKNNQAARIAPPPSLKGTKSFGSVNEDQDGAICKNSKTKVEHKCAMITGLTHNLDKVKFKRSKPVEDMVIVSNKTIIPYNCDKNNSCIASMDELSKNLTWKLKYFPLQFENSKGEVYKKTGVYLSSCFFSYLPGKFCKQNYIQLYELGFISLALFCCIIMWFVLYMRRKATDMLRAIVNHLKQGAANNGKCPCLFIVIHGMMDKKSDSQVDRVELYKRAVDEGRCRIHGYEITVKDRALFKAALFFVCNENPAVSKEEKPFYRHWLRQCRNLAALEARKCCVCCLGCLTCGRYGYLRTPKDSIDEIHKTNLPGDLEAGMPSSAAELEAQRKKDDDMAKFFQRMNERTFFTRGRGYFSSCTILIVAALCLIQPITAVEVEHDEESRIACFNASHIGEVGLYVRGGEFIKLEPFCLGYVPYKFIPSIFFLFLDDLCKGEWTYNSYVIVFAMICALFGFMKLSWWIIVSIIYRPISFYIWWKSKGRARQSKFLKALEDAQYEYEAALIRYYCSEGILPSLRRPMIRNIEHARHSVNRENMVRQVRGSRSLGNSPTTSFIEHDNNIYQSISQDDPDDKQVYSNLVLSDTDVEQRYVKMRMDQDPYKTTGTIQPQIRAEMEEEYDQQVLQMKKKKRSYLSMLKCGGGSAFFIYLTLFIIIISGAAGLEQDNLPFQTLEEESTFFLPNRVGKSESIYKIVQGTRHNVHITIDSFRVNYVVRSHKYHYDLEFKGYQAVDCGNELHKKSGVDKKDYAQYFYERCSKSNPFYNIDKHEYKLECGQGKKCPVSGYLSTSYTHGAADQQWFFKGSYCNTGWYQFAVGVRIEQKTTTIEDTLQLVTLVPLGAEMTITISGADGKKSYLLYDSIVANTSIGLLKAKILAYPHAPLTAYRRNGVYYKLLTESTSPYSPLSYYTTKYDTECGSLVSITTSRLLLDGEYAPWKPMQKMAYDKVLLSNIIKHNMRPLDKLGFHVVEDEYRVSLKDGGMTGNIQVYNKNGFSAAWTYNGIYRTTRTLGRALTIIVTSATCDYGTGTLKLNVTGSCKDGYMAFNTGTAVICDISSVECIERVYRVFTTCSIPEDIETNFDIKMDDVTKALKTTCKKQLVMKDDFRTLEEMHVITSTEGNGGFKFGGFFPQLDLFGEIIAYIFISVISASILITIISCCNIIAKRRTMSNMNLSGYSASAFQDPETRFQQRAYTQELTNFKNTLMRPIRYFRPKTHLSFADELAGMEEETRFNISDEDTDECSDLEDCEDCTVCSYTGPTVKLFNHILDNHKALLIDIHKDIAEVFKTHKCKHNLLGIRDTCSQCMKRFELCYGKMLTCLDKPENKPTWKSVPKEMRESVVIGIDADRDYDTTENQDLMLVPGDNVRNRPQQQQQQEELEVVYPDGSPDSKDYTGPPVYAKKKQRPITDDTSSVASGSTTSGVTIHSDTSNTTSTKTKKPVDKKGRLRGGYRNMQNYFDQYPRGPATYSRGYYSPNPEPYYPRW